MVPHQGNNFWSGSCRDFLENRQINGEFVPSLNSIPNALNLCLKIIYFTFGDKIYKQKGGVGTGIKLSPTYACIGIGKYEDMFFSSDQAVLEKINLWKRFIDDVLMLFMGTENECTNLVDWLNSNNQ